MAEVLAIASGVAGILSLTIEVIGISYKYIAGVRGASDTVQGFVKELEELKVVLLKIEEIAEESDDRQIFGDSGSCLLSIEDGGDYLELLGSIHEKLKKGSGHDSFRKKLRALTWPFSEDKTLALISMLHRHLEIFKTALAIDALTVGKLTLSEVRESRNAQQDRQIEAVLDWLSPLNMHQRQQDTLSRRHSTTGSWLLSTNSFQRWVLSDGSHRTLWCPGDPGTGKTVMTSIVVDHLTRTYTNDDVRIAYVYCDYKDQVTQTASNLIASLTRQLIGRPKKLPHQLENLYKKLEPLRRRPDFGELVSLMVPLCNERERTFILIDALDECEAIQQRRRLLPLLQSLSRGSCQLFITSRPNNEDICNIFTSASQITIAAPDSDIQRFVTEKMEERMEFVERLTPKLKSEIISVITARASGMFLLAVLQIDRICLARTITRIKSLLNSMPRELDELYQETLDRIQKQHGDDGELGMRVLSWVTHARRPLLVEELLHSLAIDYNEDGEQPKTFDEENLLSPKSLIDVCAGLVVIDSASQIVRLVHYTTQEFFDKERLHLFKDADEDISRACLTYLCYDTCSAHPGSEGRVPETLVTHPFLGYASLHWLSHVKGRHTEIGHSPIFPKAVVYVNNGIKLQFCAMIWRRLLLSTRKYTSSDTRAREGMLPLSAASECGLWEYVEFLLENARFPQALLDDALHCASSKGHADIAVLLIAYGARVQSLADDSSNALQRACKGGHLEVAKVLVGADAAIVNTSDRWLWTPLHHATHGGHSSLVALLLKHRADQAARTPLGLTACHLAASRGDSATVRLLVDDIRFKTREERTPLHSAAAGGHLDVIRMLLKYGADVSAVDRYGKTPRDLVQSDNLKEVEEVFSAQLEASFGQQTANPSIDDNLKEVEEVFSAQSEASFKQQTANPSIDDNLKEVEEVFSAQSEASFGQQTANPSIDEPCIRPWRGDRNVGDSLLDEDQGLVKFTVDPVDGDPVLLFHAGRPASPDPIEIWSQPMSPDWNLQWESFDF